MTRRPTLGVERALLRRDVDVVAGVDEVGRGALAGPVSVGVVAVTHGIRPAPLGLFDSKALSDRARRSLAPRIRSWASATAVGHAQPDEIDRLGIMGALRLAFDRALSELTLVPEVIVLDGSVDYTDQSIPVVLRVKGDVHCSTVAAASVIAKVARDDVMDGLALAHPAYAWHRNKGYGTPVHVAALEALGVSPHHRRSWRLPSTGATPKV